MREEDFSILRKNGFEKFRVAGVDRRDWKRREVEVKKTEHLVRQDLLEREVLERSSFDFDEIGSVRN